MRLLRFFRSRRGFTLIELLVTLSITGLLTGLIVTYSRSGERNIALYVATQQLAGVLFRAKSMALAPNATANPNQCGYGVSIDYEKNAYSLFAYEEPNPPNCAALTSIPPAFRTVLATYTLDARLDFVKADIDANLVLFVPPNPTTLLSADDGGTLLSGPTQIILETADRAVQRSITLNPAGTIDF